VAAVQIYALASGGLRARYESSPNTTRKNNAEMEKSRKHTFSTRRKQVRNQLCLLDESLVTQLLRSKNLNRAEGFHDIPSVCGVRVRVDFIRAFLRKAMATA
jgi:hypothetical protein